MRIVWGRHKLSLDFPQHVFLLLLLLLFFFRIDGRARFSRLTLAIDDWSIAYLQQHSLFHPEKFIHKTFCVSTFGFTLYLDWNGFQKYSMHINRKRAIYLLLLCKQKQFRPISRRRLSSQIEDEKKKYSKHSCLLSSLQKYEFILSIFLGDRMAFISSDMTQCKSRLDLCERKWSHTVKTTTNPPMKTDCVDLHEKIENATANWGYHLILVSII